MIALLSPCWAKWIPGNNLHLILVSPRGFCAGVDRAIAIVDRALERFGAPIYVRHEVVHNRFVVEGLESKGAVFVDELDQVPDGSIVIFSAHGVSRTVRREAAARELRVFDATCPLVTKVHTEVGRYERGGRECVLIGHAGHPEVEGTQGQYESELGNMYLVESPAQAMTLAVRDPEQLSFVTQTTLSMDDTMEIVDILRARFPAISGPKKDDICYATQNRQDGVKRAAPECDVFVVVGSRNSSNSNRLREIAEKMGSRAYLVDDAEDLQKEWFDDVKAVGITAGASAPEVLVQGVVERLISWDGVLVNEIRGKTERVRFSLPVELA